MFDLQARLADRESPVAVGLAGAGQFGTRLLAQLERAPGLRPAAVADPATDRAIGALAEAGVPRDEVAAVDGTEAADGALAGGERAVLPDGTALARSDVEVLVEATGDPFAGARHADAAIEAGTGVVMATVEADAVVGPVFAERARERGVAYSLAYGDQPALIAELVGWARTAGLHVVAAGRGAAAHDANVAIELCSAANATDLAPPPDGLAAPAVSLPEVPERLRPAADGGVLDATGVVEAAVSPPGEERVPGRSIADGVFVVVTDPLESTRSFVRAKNRAGAHVAGEYLAFFRSHHLPGTETTVSVARAALGEHTGRPRGRAADVVAVAEDSLDAGTVIDVTYPETDAPVSARIEPAAAADAGEHVPLPLLGGATVERRIAAGDVLARGDVSVPDSMLSSLRDRAPPGER